MVETQEMSRLKILVLDSNVDGIRVHWADALENNDSVLTAWLRKAKVLFAGLDELDKDGYGVPHLLADFEPDVLIIDARDNPGQRQRCAELLDTFCRGTPTDPVIVAVGGTSLAIVSPSASRIGRHSIKHWATRSAAGLHQALKEAVPDHASLRQRRTSPAMGSQPISLGKISIEAAAILFLSRSSAFATDQWESVKIHLADLGLYSWEINWDVRFVDMHDPVIRIQKQIEGFAPQVVIVDQGDERTAPIVELLLERRPNMFLIGNGLLFATGLVNGRPLDAKVGVSDSRGLAQAIVLGLSRFSDSSPAEEGTEEKGEAEGDSLF